MKGGILSSAPSLHSCTPLLLYSSPPSLHHCIIPHHGRWERKEEEKDGGEEGGSLHHYMPSLHSHTPPLHPHPPITTHHGRWRGRTEHKEEEGTEEREEMEEKRMGAVQEGDGEDGALQRKAMLSAGGERGGGDQVPACIACNACRSRRPVVLEDKGRGLEAGPSASLGPWGPDPGPFRLCRRQDPGRTPARTPSGVGRGPY